MSDWKENKLGDYIEVINGFAFKSANFLAEQKDNTLPIIKIKNVANGDVHLNDCQYHIFDDSLRKYLISKGDILISLTADETRLINTIENNEHLVDDGIDIIRTAEKYYRSKDTVAKQRIVSSIYPNKLVFDKTGYRTPENLKFVNLLCRVDKAFKGNKKGKKTEISVSSLEVDFTDKISNQLLKDIETLSSLKRYISSH